MTVLTALLSTITTLMSIIRPFRADDLFRFNNMCVPCPQFSPVTSRVHRPLSLHQATSTFGQKRCVPAACHALPNTTPHSRSHVRAESARDYSCIILVFPPRTQYGLGFYFNYLSRWPDMCCTAQHPSGRLMGYGTSIFCYRQPVTQLHLNSLGQGRRLSS